jgi:hypothetical protein
MIDLFGNDITPLMKEVERIKRNWLNAFQRWCDREGQDEYTSLGICGYGAMCDYCEDSGKPKPCARALKAMLRETGRTIDYNNADPCDVWNGDF